MKIQRNLYSKSIALVRGGARWWGGGDYALATQIHALIGWQHFSKSELNIQHSSRSPLAAHCSQLAVSQIFF